MTLKYYLIFGTVALVSFLSCDSPQEKMNYQNLKKVKKGMRIEEVLGIMGKPDTILLFNPENYGYMYNAPSGMSDNFYIYITREDSIVVGINDGT